MNKSKRPSITFLAPLYISIPVLFLGITLSYIWNMQSRGSVEQISGEYITQIHTLVQNEIDEIVAMPPRISSINKSMFEEGFLDADNFDAWMETFKEEFYSFEWLSAIVWGDADGRALWIGRYADGNVYWAIKDDPESKLMLEWQLDGDGNFIPETKNSFEYDLFSRPWFIGPSESGQAQWTKPFVWAGGEGSEGVTVGISYGIPIVDQDGALVGIMDTDFSLNDLSAYLSTIKIGKSGNAMIVTDDGDIIASSNSLDNVTDDGKLQKLSETANPLAISTDRFLTQYKSSMGSQLISGEIQVNGESIFITSSEVGRAVGLNWSLITLVPESDFLSEIDKSYFDSAVISLIAVLFSVFLGFFASKWLVKPLLQLTQFTQSVSKDTLGKRIHLSHTHEYDELGNSINAMLESLFLSSQEELKLSSELDHRISELEQLQSRLGAIIDSTLNSIITINSNSEVVDLNQVSEQMFGYSREEAIGQSIADLIIPENFREAHKKGMSHYMQTGEGPILNTTIEVPALKKTGEEFPIKLEIVPFEMNGERFFTATIQDISLAKEQEEKLKASREHEVLLNRELDHRVKNMLAQIVSICRQSANKATTDKDMLEDLTIRVTGIASIHELLASNSNISITLNALIEACCKPYVSGQSDLLDVSGPEINLNSKAVLCLGMVFNELANNSMKYGALLNSQGSVEINWTIQESEDSKALELNWIEKHSGALPETIDGGLGSKIIRFAIPHELEGTAEVAVNENGIQFKSAIPMESIE